MPIVQFQSINMSWEDFSWIVWCACRGRNITTVFIALLLDKYLMKLHYCSNTFVFPRYLYGREFNCLCFYSILYFRALTCIKYFCVCLLNTFQKVCMYCIFVFAYCHFEQAKYYANCTRPKKKKKETEINFGCRLKTNLCKANSFVLSVLFCLPHPLMIGWFWWTCIR